MFYVYAYLDPRVEGRFEYGSHCFLNQPFYIGKGVGNRINAHKWEVGRRKSFKSNVIKAILSVGLVPIILKLHENLTESGAFNLETQLIKLIGRRDLGSGSLTNLTDGGEGHVGFVQSEETKQKRKISLGKSSHSQTVSSPEFRAKMSAIMTDRYDQTDLREKVTSFMRGPNNPARGKPSSEAQKASVRKIHAEGRFKLTPEGRERLASNGKKRLGQKSTKVYSSAKICLLIDPNGAEYPIMGKVRMQEFCSVHKIQYHLFLQNPDTQITKEHLKSKHENAVNTVGWWFRHVTP